MLSMAKALI